MEFLNWISLKFVRNGSSDSNTSFVLVIARCWTEPMLTQFTATYAAIGEDESMYIV